MITRPTEQEIKLLRQRYSQPTKQVAKVFKVWELYYGANKLPWYKSENYGWCRAEQKRLMSAGMGYKEQLFKIK